MDSLMEEFAIMSAETSPMRSTVINSASSTRKSLRINNSGVYALSSLRPFLVQEQQDFYEESRRKIVSGAKAYVEEGIERQRVGMVHRTLLRRFC